MKNFIIVLLLCLCFICNVMAGEKSTDTLTKIENSFLGMTYTDQKIEKRLDRIEEYVYGAKKQGKPSDRLNKLAKDIHADMIGQEITPCEDTLALEEDDAADSSVDYPVLNDVEKSLNIKSKPQQSLHSRLVAIEKKLFNSVYDTDNFYTRVERIKGKVYKNSDVIAQNYDEDEDIYLPEYSDDSSFFDGWNTDRIFKRKKPYDTSSVSSKLSKLEKKVLHTTYPDENDNDRLARLENQVFDTEFYYDDENERLDRLEGAIRGQKTANRYDNNKLQQRLNTAMQIGAMILMVLACIL